MNQDEYGAFLSEWALEAAEEMAIQDLSQQSNIQTPASNDKDQLFAMLTQSENLPNLDPNTPVEEQIQKLTEEYYYLPDPNTITVPGPYGPIWPNVTHPAEFTIGQANITIAIQDENAKMPLTWALTKDKNIDLQAQAALETFCDWMQMDNSEINKLLDQLEEIKGKKQFKLENPKKPNAALDKKKPKGALAKKARSALANTTDFARLFNSAMLDTEKLAWAIPDTGLRTESPLKYLALWGSQKVNINSAPRHVLEAAFTFGGQESDIADEIIKIRKEKPFKDLDELRQQLYQFADSIEKAKPYITTESTFLTIKVTAVSGNAKKSAVAAVVKNGKKVEKIAVISY
jgi:hypothetical protein